MTDVLQRVGFIVVGAPVPWERARYSRKTGKFFTPARTRSYQELVGWHARMAIQVPSLWPMCAQYELAVDVYFPDARRRDADNVLKTIKDACTKILWDDDSQVAKATVEKRIEKANPRVEVSVIARAK